MAYIRCGGGGIPAALKSDMNAVFNKKFETSTTYPPNTWADTVNLMGALPIRSANGTIATFNDGADLVPLKSCEVTVTPSQSGTGDPSPTNPRPLNSFSSLTVEHTGANLWNEDWELGSLTASGTDYPSTARIRSKGYTEIKEGLTYFVFSSGETADIHFYDENKDHLSYVQRTNTTFTTPTGAKYIRFCMSVAYGTTYNNNISINYPSTDTSYHAHVTPDPHTLALGSTVYGLTGDCVTGEFEETHGVILDLSSLSWTYQSANSRFVSTSIASVVKAPPNNSTIIENALCEIYKVDISNNTASSAYDNIIAVSSNGNIQIRDTSLNGDLDALSVRLNGKKFAYPLATPTALTIDPVEVESFKGVNNIWCTQDNSTAAVEYRADIDLLITELGG